MKKILILLLFCGFWANAQQYHDKGAKFENATNAGDTITVDTRIPIIDEFGLINYYVDVADLLALNPAPVLEWGNITGTLSDQTDLQGALNDKADQSDLTAHTSNGSIHFTQSAISITESQVSDLKDYLRGDVNDTNGTNKLTLGSLEVVGQTTLQNGLNLTSVPVGTSDNILTLNQSTGDVEQRVFSLGDIDIANASGVSQFPVGLGDQLRIQGSGDTSISFDGVTNTINITSIPGSGTGGSVTSFNGRTGGVVSQAGDYSTAMVNENTNLYFTEPRVRSTPLTGLTVTNTPISSTNTFIQALGRLQGQVNDREVAFSKNTAFNKNFGRSAGTVLEGNDTAVDSDKLGGNTPDMYVPLQANKQAIEVSSGSADDVRGTGFFNFQGTISNLPSTGGHTVIEVARSNNGNRFQMASNHRDNSTYTRSYINGSWSNWAKFWNTDNFNPSDYTPTSRMITIAGQTKDLSANRAWNLYTLSVGDGILGNTYDGSVTRIWNIDPNYAGFNNYYTKTESDGNFVSTDGNNSAIEVSGGSANDIRPIGFYNLQSAVTDKPSSGGAKIINVRRNNNESFQIAAENTTGNDFWVRNKIGGVWNSWDKLYHSGNLRSDSQNDARYAILNATNTGSITFTGDVIANSDKRLKKNIKRIDNALAIVQLLGGYEYDRKDIDLHQAGVIAQEVEEVFPIAVSTADDKQKTKSVAYNQLIALLIEAIKEQQIEIENLKTLINEK